MKFAMTVLLGMLWSTNAFSQVNSLPTQPHLLVKGQAERTVTPDRFRVNLSLQRVDLSPEVARRLARDDAASILSAFKASDALPDSIEASTLSIHPDFRVREGERVFEGTRVARTLAATFSSVEEVRRLLAMIDTSENVLFNGVTSQYSQESSLRAQLKREAAEQTRESAQGLASAYGARILGLYTISDVAPSFAYGVQAGTWPRGADNFHPPAPPAPLHDVGSVAVSGQRLAEALEAGSLRIAENVYAIFLIAP